MLNGGEGGICATKGKQKKKCVVWFWGNIKSACNESCYFFSREGGIANRLFLMNLSLSMLRLKTKHCLFLFYLPKTNLVFKNSNSDR